ncbi:MAG: hypothetical protein HY074_14915 [Deltaproteobacteria bacterium]|nr:hypothetical protein [Deltaproteobacteria bacterium]
MTHASGILIFILAAAAGLVAGCSLDVPKTNGPSLHVQLKETDADKASAKPFYEDVAGRLLYGNAYGLLSTGPSATSDFNCFAINVTGQGVAASVQFGSNGCTSPDNMRGKGFGQVATPGPRGTNMSVAIPAATAVNVDVYGVFPPLRECGATSFTSSPQFFFMGTADIAPVTSDTTVTVPVAFASGTAASLTCTGSSGSSGGANPFGTGSTGAFTASAGTNVNTATISSARAVVPTNRLTGVAGSIYNLGGSVGANDYLVGDEIATFVVGFGGSGQCGTGVAPGQVNFARITSVSGSNVTVDNPVAALNGNANLANTTGSGTTFCAIVLVRVPNFSSLTINPGGSLTVTPFSYTSVTGGIIIVRVNGALTVASSGSILADADGYNGGGGGGPTGANGDGHAGTGTPSASANGVGGGGGTSGSGGGSGGTSTSPGAQGGNSGGAAGGNLACQNCPIFGGGGGGGGGSGAGGGGIGGGIIMVFAKTLSIGSLLTVSANGSAGSAGTTGTGGGGGGGGGFIQFVSQGNSNGITVTATGAGGGNGGAGASGGAGAGGGTINFNTCVSASPSLTAGGGGGGTGSFSGTSGGTGGVGTNSSSTQGFCSF